MNAYSRPCDRTYHAARTSGTRPASKVQWIVLHSTEGGTAESVARYFAQPDAAGSAHLVVDDFNCYRTLANDEIPWAAPGANTTGFHIEQCGYARWTSEAWRAHDAMLRRAAYKTAIHCRLFEIPVRFCGPWLVKFGFGGITTHAVCTKVFGGTHTDPGSGWPRRYFMKLVREYHAALDV